MTGGFEEHPQRNPNRPARAYSGFAFVSGKAGIFSAKQLLIDRRFGYGVKHHRTISPLTESFTWAECSGGHYNCCRADPSGLMMGTFHAVEEKQPPGMPRRLAFNQSILVKGWIIKTIQLLVKMGLCPALFLHDIGDHRDGEVLAFVGFDRVVDDDSEP